MKKLGGTISEAAFVARPGEKPAGAVEEEVHVLAIDFSEAVSIVVEAPAKN
jgi:hypothetical protein